MGSRNQRSKEIKVKLALRTCLVLAIGVWMIYQLRLFLSQKISSENGSSSEGEIQLTEQLNLGRKGLVLMDEEVSNSNGKEQSGKGKTQSKMDEEEETETEQIEDLVDGVDKGGDGDDEEIETERFEDPMEEIEPLNDDDEGDDENGENTNVQQQRKEDGGAWGSLNKDEADAKIRVAGS